MTVSALTTSSADVVEIAEVVDEPFSTACWPFQNSPERSRRDLRRSPRPRLTTAMNCWWISSIKPRAYALPVRLRRERVEHALVVARRQHAAPDAELLHRADEAEAVDEHADRADDRRLVDVDLVGRDGDVVGAGGADVPTTAYTFFLVQRLQAHDLVVDDACLDRAATRRVDPQHDRRAPSSRTRSSAPRRGSRRSPSLEASISP